MQSLDSAYEITVGASTRLSSDVNLASLFDEVRAETPTGQFLTITRQGDRRDWVQARRDSVTGSWDFEVARDEKLLQKGSLTEVEVSTFVEGWLANAPLPNIEWTDVSVLLT